MMELLLGTHPLRLRRGTARPICLAVYLAATGYTEPATAGSEVDDLLSQAGAVHRIQQGQLAGIAAMLDRLEMGWESTSQLIVPTQRTGRRDSIFGRWYRRVWSSADSERIDLDGDPKLYIETRVVLDGSDRYRLIFPTEIENELNFMESQSFEHHLGPDGRTLGVEGFKPYWGFGATIRSLVPHEIVPDEERPPHEVSRRRAAAAALALLSYSLPDRPLVAATRDARTGVVSIGTRQALLYNKAAPHDQGIDRADAAPFLPHR